MILRSAKYNDIYFSVEDGLAETTHVFLNGNKVTEKWQNQKNFIIGETGFGTGLNFLATWKLFEETAPNGHHLHFISFEKYPLSPRDVGEALSIWRDDLGFYIDQYLKLYPLRVPGPHTIHFTPYVTLTVWIGDIDNILPEWQGFSVDAWFLDGFTPAKNPEMWSENLFSHMARLSYNGTTFASFTAAGHVRRGLAEVGFGVRKEKGFGRKRDMICGEYNCDHNKIINKPVKTIAIVGGGLAGCSLAYLANLKGMKATIYEASDKLASGASGGKLGMINPKLTAKPTPHSDYYTSCYANAVRMLTQINNDVEFQQCGSLHLCIDEDKDRRFKGYIENLGWYENHILRVGEDLLYPDSGCVSPVDLCHALATNADIKFNSLVSDLGELNEDIIVVANSFAVNTLIKENLPVSSVRGQVSWIKRQSSIDQNICYGGYVTPLSREGFHIVGATFQPWEDHCEVTDADHVLNIENFNKVMTNNLQKTDVIGGWAALRASSKDRFPIVGHLKENIYLSVAHGSHGIISSLMAAEIIMADILRQPVPATQNVLKALSPDRFL